MIQQIRYKRNPHQREFDEDLTSKFLHLNAGFGCLRDSTQIITSKGLLPIADVTDSTLVLSQTDSGLLELAPSSNSFPKGKANLYRVITTQGEFVANEFHRVFSSQCSYTQVGKLSVGDCLYSYSPDQILSTSEHAPLTCGINDPRYYRTRANYQSSYEVYNSLCDLQLLSDQGNVQDVSPLLNDALISSRLIYLNAFEQMDDQHSQTQERNHLEVSSYQSYTGGYSYRSLLHDLNAEGYNEASELEHISRYNQQSQQFQQTNDCHHTNSLSSQHCISPGMTLTKSIIISIEKLTKAEWYWDIQVANNHNYFTQDGTLHHNSGKTHALCMKALRLSWLNRPYHGGLMAPSFKDLKRDVIEVMDDILEANGIRARHHKTDHYYQFPWSKGKLFLISAENKLRGPNLAYMLINEATLMDAVRYKEAIGRVRQKGARVPQIASVGTPEGVGNFMYERFVDNPMRNSKIIYGDTRDNLENLDPDYVRSLEDSYDKTMLDAYLRGLWVNMNGNQFYYAFDPEKNEDRSIAFDRNLDVHCFLDFNVRYMTCTLWHLIDTYAGKQLQGFDEIVIENNADTNKMIERLRQQGYTEHNTIIYPDPAGKARRTNGKGDHIILQDAGYEVKAKRAAPRMRDRQLNVNNLLDKQQIIFNPDTMPSLRRDLQAVEQNQDTMDKNKKNDKLTHASDGLDYGCDILFPTSGKRNKSAIIEYR